MRVVGGAKKFNGLLLDWLLLPSRDGKGAKGARGASVRDWLETFWTGLRECASVAHPPKKPSKLTPVIKICKIFLKFFICFSLCLTNINKG
jgi:hypothetical protein